MIASIVFLVLLVLVVVAIVQITLGFRGRPTFSEPRCAACNYDLRAANYLDGKPKACPECGKSLEAPNAVSFGRYQRAPRRIYAGLLILILMLLGLVTLPMMLSSRVGPGAAATRTKAQLIAALATTASQPWDWQELERRYTAGDLSAAEADQAMAALATHMRSLPSSEPLHWCDSFVQKLLSDGVLSAERRKDLCVSHFKDPVRISIPLVNRAGASVRPQLDSANVWQMANHREVWFLKQVLDGDKPLQLRQADGKDNPDLFSAGRNHSVWNINLAMPETPGEHELTFVFDHGAIPETEPLRGLDGRPGTPDKWPKPLAIWQVEQKVKVRIVPKDTSPVELVTDPARDPGTALVKRCMIRPRTGGSEAVIEWHGTPIPVCGKLIIRIGDQSFDAGKVWISQGGDAGPKPLPQLPPGNLADLRIDPDPDHAERSFTPRAIWGKPIELKNVHLERFDTPAK